MFEAIKRFFCSAIKKLWSILKKIISSALEKFLADMWDLAVEIVKELAATDLSNEDKRKKAGRMIIDKAVDKGIEYKESWVNALIELAYISIKKEF